MNKRSSSRTHHFHRHNNGTITRPARIRSVVDLEYDDPSTRSTAAAAVFTPASHDSHEFVTLEDTDSDDDDDDDDHMAPRRRRQPSAIVDLTEGSPDPARQPKRKRSADNASSTGDARAKRRRASAEEIEEIDLSNEAPSVEEELLQAQQQEAIRVQQQALEDSAPQRIGKRQCIICLENFTNCTATACGHFFCHECLMQALIAAARNSDRQTGSCPVCRKSLSHKKKGDVLPIAFMTKKEYDTRYKDRPRA